MCFTIISVRKQASSLHFQPSKRSSFRIKRRAHVPPVETRVSRSVARRRRARTRDYSSIVFWFSSRFEPSSFLSRSGDCVLHRAARTVGSLLIELGHRQLPAVSFFALSVLETDRDLCVTWFMPPCVCPYFFLILFHAVCVCRLSGHIHLPTLPNFT